MSIQKELALPIDNKHYQFELPIGHTGFGNIFKGNSTDNVNVYMCTETVVNYKKELLLFLHINIKNWVGDEYYFIKLFVTLNIPNKHIDLHIYFNQVDGPHYVITLYDRTHKIIEYPINVTERKEDNEQN